MALRGGDVLARAILRKSYDHRHSLLTAREYAFRYERKLAAGEFDIIFAPVASTEISLLKTNLPIVYLSDILFPDYQDYYPQCSRLLAFSSAEVGRIEALAMYKASAFICPSDWVGKRAMETYGLPKDRVHVLSFGANLAKEPTFEDATRRRSLDVCRLLFLGVDWKRKGGMVAFETLQCLLDAGVDAELTICGCVPPSGISHPKMTVIPFLSKRDPAQAARLAELLHSSTVLILPTQADAAPIVICEACAYGLPAIVRDTGGVGSVVEDGVNGYKVAPHEGAPAYARIIMNLCRNPERYRTLSVSARRTYEQRLNWNAWGRGAQMVFESVTDRRRSADLVIGQ
jgi:glycosyltransferase involved in cell wall biosynthesis